MTRDPSPATSAGTIAAVVLLSLYVTLLVRANSLIAGGSDSSGYLNATSLFQSLWRLEGP